MRAATKRDTMLDSRCHASSAASRPVIYPLTYVDWVWFKNGGTAETEGVEGEAVGGRGGVRMKDYIKKKLHLTVTG